MKIIEKKFPIQSDALFHFEQYFSESPAEYLFFDIETTGLSKERSYIYLIGLAEIISINELKITQYLISEKDEEPILLKTFQDKARHYHNIVHYNGKHFDLPFYDYRCMRYGFDNILSDFHSIDLYLLLKSCRSLLPLAHFRQTDLEEFLDPNAERCCSDGKECIALYRKYSKKQSPELEAVIAGHNEEDLKGLFRILSLLSYLRFLTGHYDIQSVNKLQTSIIIKAVLYSPVPVTVTKVFPDGYIKLDQTDFYLELKLNNDRLRRYYEDYKNYYYLPAEDYAITKELAKYVFADSKIPATAETCYTWFTVTDSFLKSFAEIKKFIQDNLEIWTGFSSQKTP